MLNQRAVLCVLVMLSLLVACGRARSQGLPGLRAKATPKVGAVLSTLYEQYMAHESQQGGTDFKTDDPLIRIVEDRVVIDAVASGYTGTLRMDLEALGMRKAVSFGRIVSGELPITAILDADALDSLKSARPAGAANRRPPAGARAPRP